MANKELNLKQECVICRKKINFELDRYVNLRDFIGRNMEDECFYHLECWKNMAQVVQQRAINEVVSPLLKQANVMLNSGGYN